MSTSSGYIAVKVDDKYNNRSKNGYFWFKRYELRIVEEEKNNMEGYSRVAIVNLVEDYSKKDYGFALYDTEMELIKNINTLDEPAYVIVNPRNKNNKILGIVKSIMTTEEYGEDVSSQVVGVVNMDGYIARIAEENRLKELAKKKSDIEKELEKEIKKRRSVEYYKEMANKYSDNPRLAELVKELKELGE